MEAQDEIPEETKATIECMKRIGDAFIKRDTRVFTNVRIRTENGDFTPFFVDLQNVIKKNLLLGLDIDPLVNETTLKFCDFPSDVVDKVKRFKKYL